MAAIHELLNPIPAEIHSTKPDRLQESIPEVKVDSNSTPASPLLRKKPKLCKDAAIFIRGPVRGDCRYPPQEYQDDFLAQQHEKFAVFPIGKIADYPRHIPYSSDKKSFWENTGRESLEVFQYQFKVPGDETTYTMLWDYNIGLVRTTPLFKCTGYSKTTPAKMLNRNSGLRDICHSITGGALVAQGYWMPYEAARAVAATFCYTIRFALTPVFGIDFPEICIPPDSPKFGEMYIDPEITVRCTKQARAYRQTSEQHSSRASSSLPSPKTPVTPTSVRNLKHLRMKEYDTKSNGSEYSSDDGHADKYLLSPMTPSPGPSPTKWTPTNPPRSCPQVESFFPVRVGSNIVSPRKKLKRHRKVSESSSEEGMGKARKTTRVWSGIARDCSSDGDSDSDEDAVMPGLAPDNSSVIASNDEKAAHLLMGLRLQHVDREEKPSPLKRRAST